MRCSSHSRWSRGAAAGWTAWLVVLGLGVPIRAYDSTAAGAHAPDGHSPDSVIAHWIKELGAEHYARREKAQIELRRLGLAAFEALHEAQDHEDVEIALRARYLVRSMAIPWVRDDDPSEVRDLLRGYADKPNDERRGVMEQLARLAELQGLPALCRLTRFETANLLSKQAALLVLQRGLAAEPPQAARLAGELARELGPSRRTGVRWLERLVETLKGSAAASWDGLVREEERVFHETPEKSSPQIVRDLLRWHAAVLEREHRPREALAEVTRSLELLDGTAEQLLEMADWLIDRKAWALVDRLAQRFPERFAEQAALGYRLAEVQLRQGRQDQAEQIVQRVLQLRMENPLENTRTAVALQERGLFEWAEREYRRAIQAGPPGAAHDLDARARLGEMLHDLGRERPAAEVLQGAVAVLDKNPKAAETVVRGGRDPGALRSRMHFFYAEHFRAVGDKRQQLEHLRQGARHDASDADLLIAMYRAQPDDKEWRTMVRQHIQQAAKTFRDQIQQVQQQATQVDNEDVRAVFNHQLALLCNQLAWLIGNTEGDYEEAVRLSRKSLELRPNTAGYLDTLGRCYYAKGDYDNAVKYQARALELEPHSGLMRRQLELFQRALQEHKRKGTAAPPP